MLLYFIELIIYMLLLSAYEEGHLIIVQNKSPIYPPATAKNAHMETDSNQYLFCDRLYWLYFDVLMCDGQNPHNHTDKVFAWQLHMKTQSGLKTILRFMSFWE